MLWGEHHLHTSWSADAIAAGTRVGPDEALRFAKGEEITSNTGQPVKLSRPSTGWWSPTIPTRSA